MGVNGLDVAGLRPFDLVIPFTIKKGEITGKSWGQMLWGCSPWRQPLTSNRLSPSPAAGFPPHPTRGPLGQGRS